MKGNCTRTGWKMSKRVNNTFLRERKKLYCNLLCARQYAQINTFAFSKFTTYKVMSSSSSHRWKRLGLRDVEQLSWSHTAFKQQIQTQNSWPESSSLSTTGLLSTPASVEARLLSVFAQLWKRCGSYEHGRYTGELNSQVCKVNPEKSWRRTCEAAKSIRRRTL